MSGKKEGIEAIIVAAGFGSRLQVLRPGGELIKPLEPVGGIPIMRRVIEAAFAAGIARLHIVTGHMADELTDAVLGWQPPGPVLFAHNPRYELSNGISLHVGACRCRGDYVLLMADHLFERRTLEGLLAHGLAGNRAVLAVDYKVSQVFDLDDATKVRAADGKVERIGKELSEYNAVDTGMFLLSGDVTQRLGALIEARGDASISKVMELFIADGKMGAFDIGPGRWQDVDTPEMLAEAERLVAAGYDWNVGT